MTRIPTAELLALKEQMTKGPWKATKANPQEGPEDVVMAGEFFIAGCYNGFRDENAPVVHARAIAHLPDVIEENLALRALLEQAEAVLEPFSEMAGEMFARNWNKDSVAISFVGVDGPIRLTFAEFMGARSTLAALRQHREASHG